MAITARHTFGWKKEEQLKPILESLHNLSFIKTYNRYDCIDFINPTLNVELKSRVGSSTDYPTWLLPVIKANKAEREPNPTVFYYYWTTDSTLWKLNYNKELFNTFRREFPSFNQYQEHFFIDADEWEYVGEVDLNNGCLKPTVDE
jgi:hypothetical protein